MDGSPLSQPDPGPPVALEPGPDLDRGEGVGPGVGPGLAGAGLPVARAAGAVGQVLPVAGAVDRALAAVAAATGGPVGWVVVGAPSGNGGSGPVPVVTATGSVALTDPATGSVALVDPVTGGVAVVDATTGSLAMVDPGAGTVSVVDPVARTLAVIHQASGSLTVIDQASGLVSTSGRAVTLAGASPGATGLDTRAATGTAIATVPGGTTAGGAAGAGAAGVRAPRGRRPAGAGPADPTGLIDSPRAWVAAVAASAVNGVGFGIAYTFGTFFKAMAGEFHASNSATALIFGVTLLFFFGSGVVTGPVFDRVGPRPILAVGGTLFAGGLALTAAAPNLAVAVLTYGIGVGVGCGLFVAPLTAMVGRLFVVNRLTALSLAALGSGLGTLVMSPLAQSVIANHGWRTAYLVLAGIAAVIVAFGLVAVVKPPSPAAGLAPGQRIETARESARRCASDRGFQSMCLASTLMSVALFVAFAFIVSFATSHGVSSQGASRLVGLIGLASIAGRLGLTRLARRIGPVRLLQLTLIIQPMAYLVWLIAGGRYLLLVVFVLLLGVSYGAFVALTAEALIYLVGLEGIGTTMGLLFFSFGIGGLIGPPGAGYLADRMKGQTTVVIIGCVVLLLAALVASIPMGRARRHEPLPPRTVLA